MSMLLVLFSAVVLLGEASCEEGTTSVELVKQRHYDLSGQTHIITGGDSGIGNGIATGLAAANARVFFLAHNMEKTADAMRRITQLTGNSQLFAFETNQLSLVSVEAAVDEMLKKTDRVDAVIGDAGLDAPTDFVTKDGFNSDFEVTYLSHFYLVELLLPRLRESKGRVVYTSAPYLDPYGDELCKDSGLKMGCESLERFNQLVRTTAAKAHAHSENFIAMLMKTLHARHLSLVENDVTAYSFHPGGVKTPGLVAAGFRNPNATAAFSKACHTHLPYTKCLCGRKVSCPLTPLQGAVSGLYLAAAPKNELESINGDLTVLCGVKSGPHFDPYVTMVAKIGKPATFEYVQKLQALSRAWVKETDAVNANMQAASMYANIHGETNFDLRKLLPISSIMFSILCGLVIMWAKNDTDAIEKAKVEYKRLDSST